MEYFASLNSREKKLLLLAVAALSIGLIFLVINNTFNSYAQSKKKADKARGDYEYVISKAELLSSSLLEQSSNPVSIENFIRSNISVQSNNLKVSNQDGLIKISFSSDSFAGINPENVIAFCSAQLVGALLAFLVYKYCFKTN